MAEETDSRVILGDPGSPEVLEDAGIRGSQVILALGERDEDNLEICQMGTKLFGIGRCICWFIIPGTRGCLNSWE